MGDGEADWILDWIVVKTATQYTKFTATGESAGKRKVGIDLYPDAKQGNPYNYSNFLFFTAYMSKWKLTIV